MTHDEHETSTPFVVEMINPCDTPQFESELERLHSTSRSRQFWLLACVVLIGIGSILSMRMFGTNTDLVTPTAVDDVIIAYLHEHENNSSNRGHDQNAAFLHQSSQRAKLAAPPLRRNPFLVTLPSADTMGEVESPAESISTLRARRLDELEVIVRAVTVESTMTGRMPLASIGGEVLRTGESMYGSNDEIRIVLRDVRGSSVVLEATDATLNVSGEWIVHVGN